MLTLIWPGWDGPILPSPSGGGRSALASSTTTTDPQAVPIPLTTTSSAPSIPPAPTTTTTSPAASFQAQCAADNAYLLAHAYPWNFKILCGGYALGRPGMTCVNVPGVCPGADEIIIADPSCWTAVENEASNSWVAMGASAEPIDPFGERC